MDLVILDPSRGSRQGDAGVNDRDLRIGDLLLFCRNPRYAEPAGKFASVIRGVQTAYGYGFDDARWHHVGIYVGGGQMVEARWKQGVVAGPLAGRFPGHLLRVRRNRVCGELMQTEVGRYIGQAVNGALGKAYDVRALFAGQPNEEEERSYVCSTLFCDAHDLALDDLARGRTQAEREQLSGARLVTDATQLPLPAFLSQTQVLLDVAVGWMRKVPGHLPATKSLDIRPDRSSARPSE
jgi:hypothetical protein